MCVRKDLFSVTSRAKLLLHAPLICMSWFLLHLDLLQHAYQHFALWYMCILCHLVCLYVDAFLHVHIYIHGLAHTCVLEIRCVSILTCQCTQASAWHTCVYYVTHACSISCKTVSRRRLGINLAVRVCIGTYSCFLYMHGCVYAYRYPKEGPCIHLQLGSRDGDADLLEFLMAQGA